MKKNENYALVAVLIVAFIMSAAALGMAVAQRRSITAVEGGLFMSIAASIILALRLVRAEKRLARLESLHNGKNPKAPDFGVHDREF